MDVSVIICCYNSEKLLSNTLNHIAKQRVPSEVFYEVILVDNNSTDNTIVVAKEIWHDIGARATLKIINEPKQGIAHARKTGVLASTADVLVFCDDDNWLQEDYLLIARKFMKESPLVGALGGQSIGVLEDSEPKWWQDETQNYAVGKQQNTSGDISYRGYLWGAGLVIRKNILKKLYAVDFESNLSGRKANKLSSGDDSEICKWVLLMQYKLWYKEDLRFEHFITKVRLTDDYLIKLKNGHQDSQYVLNLYNWFIRSGYYKKIENKSLLNVFKLFLFATLAFLKRDKRWREKLQVVLGSKIKIHADFYGIFNTYRKLIKTETI